MTIKHINTEQCLDRPKAKELSTPLLKDCDGSIGQQWIMKSKFRWQAGNQALID